MNKTYNYSICMTEKKYLRECLGVDTHSTPILYTKLGLKNIHTKLHLHGLYLVCEVLW